MTATLKVSRTTLMKRRRIAAGLCRGCGYRPLEGRLICAGCLTKRNLRSKNRKVKVKEVILKAKSVPCTDCGTKLPPEIMHLDHVRGVKKLEFRLNAYWRMNAVVAELLKCEVRCPNCHALRHYKEAKRARKHQRIASVRIKR